MPKVKIPHKPRGPLIPPNKITKDGKKYDRKRDKPVMSNTDRETD